MARLVLMAPDGQQTVDLAAHNSLGRHPDNTIQLLDKIVSKNHCQILARDGGFVLRDLGSLNGTFVNGERVEGEVPLEHGDELAMGSTKARFEGEPPAHRSSTPPEPEVEPVPVSASPVGISPPAIERSGETARVGAVHDVAAQHTRVDVNDTGRSIGTQITATHKGFLPHGQLAQNPQQLGDDYERLRLSHELSREICLERDLNTLLDKILISMFRFVRADRGVIFLRDDDGTLRPGASLRRDGSAAAISVSSTIMDHVIKERATVLTHDAAMDFAGSKGKSMILHRISSAIVAPLLHDDEILGVLWLDSESLARFQPKDMELVNSIAAQAAMFIEINILGRKVEQEIVNRERFSRLLSPNVAEKVLSGEMVVKKGGQRVEQCTVFNSDIRGFTALSEGANPETIVEMLNDYFELMVETIFKYEGTLDKFMGDGIMALWGTPVQHRDDPIRAVDCALEQIAALEAFNGERVNSQAQALSIGIGIHTGPVVAGYIGSSKALSYTVIGETANTSARLCGIAEPGQLIVSETTLQALRDQFEHEELPPAHLKNMRHPFRRFAITGRPPRAQVPATLETTS